MTDTETETPVAQGPVEELFATLHLEPTAHVVATVWEWAGRHFGLTPPDQQSAAATAAPAGGADQSPPASGDDPVE